MSPKEREAYEQTKRERDEYFRKIVEVNLRDQAAVMAKLAEGGFPAADLKELIPKYAIFPLKLTELLIACLKGTTNRHLREAIVRTLCGAGPNYDPTGLIDAYDPNDRSFCFAIVNTLAVTKPAGADGFLKRLSQDPSWTKLIRNLRRASRQQLPLFECIYMRLYQSSRRNSSTDSPACLIIARNVPFATTL